MDEPENFRFPDPLKALWRDRDQILRGLKEPLTKAAVTDVVVKVELRQQGTFRLIEARNAVTPIARPSPIDELNQKACRIPTRQVVVRG